MRGLARWVTDSLAFYLALYLVDSLVSPRFHVGEVWIAVVLAVFLGLTNSFYRPLRRVRSRPATALAEAVITVLFNVLVLQVVIWAGAPLSATSIVWVLVMAAFLTFLGGLLNWLIGFKKKTRPGVSERATARERLPGHERPGGQEARNPRRRA